MSTLSTLIDQFGVDVLVHLDRQVAVPIHRELQRQGDVIIVPRPNQPTATTPIPAEGVPVVEGQQGRNTHLLLAEGPAAFDTHDLSGKSQLVGVLTVPVGSTAWLAHPEHAYTGIGPGTYEIRRQREPGARVGLGRRRARLVAD